MPRLDDMPSISRLEERKGWLGRQCEPDPRDAPDGDLDPPVQSPEKNT